MHCKHEQCHCQGNEVQQDGYCSERCRSGETSSNGKCDCGHASCGSGA
jgi:hypothetical protein